MNLLQSLDYSVLQQCMHCGMCLPTCPTYVETKLERNSPRGRISLMRSIADGDLGVTRAFADEMYYCLGCLACQTACPAGVKYAELFETSRAEVERAGVAAHDERDFWRWLTLDVLFMHPRLLRLAGWGLRLWQSTGLDRVLRRFHFLGLLPKKLRALEPQTPRMAQAFSDSLIDPVETPPEKRYRVGLLTGCVQDLAFSGINRDTADVLLANGCEVVTPRVQHCCGSLHAHNGAVEQARELARRQLDSFDLDQFDAVITNAGGCGSHLKSYGHLLHDDPFYAAKARQWDAKVKDIHEWLVHTGIRAPEHGAGVCEVTYHESCHLCHGQKVTSQPRQVLQAIPGLVLKELPESNWCCGSAGIYNITQPEQSAKLLRRKVGNIRATRAPVVATSNPGCHMQLVNGLDGSAEVTQPVTLLARAYRGGASGA
ncbi:MAG TPA: (Fe-S)-binding protein [Prosthecobacter sp.]|nr:(Fe-S)-binding protein [Prosthecobacter sp.]HRK16902.1 (Fe-S)-binding protein [Prosthecobacter sp.]